MTDNATNFLNDWKRRGLFVTILITPKRARYEEGTTVRVTKSNPDGTTAVIAMTSDLDPVSALQKAHVQILSHDTPVQQNLITEEDEPA